MSNDQQLLELISGGDKRAMHELYGRYERPLLAFLIGRGAERSEAADVVHDTMLEVWRSASKFSGKSAVKTWMFSIARNKLIDRFRKGARLSVTDDVPDMADDAPDPEALAVAAGEARRVRACLDGLSPTHKTVIRLAFYEDLNYEEISEIEDVALGTIKTRIFHAKKLLMRCLGAR